MKDKPRIGTTEWIHARPNVAAVFSAAYDDDGRPQDLPADDYRWVAITPDGYWHYRPTQAEAFEAAFYAHQEARNK